MLKSDTSNFKVSICNNPRTYLTEIPNDLPINLVKLKVVYQNLVTLRPQAFKHIYQLEYLSIVSCGLRDVSKKAFDHLGLLQILILSNNSLVIHETSNLLPEVFQPLTSLNVLDLSYNFIQSIARHFFYHIQHSLRVLIISHSKSSLTITPASLESLSRLEKLDISSNNLLQLDPGFEGVFNKMVSLQHLHLQGNPWKCDCKMRWLVFWFQHSTIYSYPLEPTTQTFMTTLCHSPRSMKNIPLLRPISKSILRGEFPCTPKCLTKDTTLMVNEKENVSIPCLFEVTGGDFDVFWSFNGENISQSDHIFYKLKKTNQLSSVLSILNFSKSSVGVWRCFIDLDGAIVGANISVNLIKSPDLSIEHFVAKSSPELISVKLIVFIVLGSMAMLFVCAILIGMCYRYLRLHRGNLRRRRRNNKHVIRDHLRGDTNSVFYNHGHDDLKCNLDTCHELCSLHNCDSGEILNNSSLSYILSSQYNSDYDNSHIFINPYIKTSTITRTPSSVPCPVHLESHSPNIIEPELQSVASSLYQPCPLHGDLLAILMQSSTNVPS